MFYYYVEYVDEKEEYESGLIAAESYSTAVEELTDYYGEENIIAMTVTDMCSNVVTEADFKDIKKEYK